MKSRAWHAAYQAAVRTTARSTHDFAAAVADQVVAHETGDGGDLIELLRRECRAKEDDLLALEERVRVLRARVRAWREVATAAHVDAAKAAPDEEEG